MKKLLLFSLSMACFAMASVAQNAADKVSKVYENRIQVRETVKPHFQMPESKMELVCNKPEKSLNLSSGRFGGLFDVEKRMLASQRNDQKQKLDSLWHFNAQGAVGDPAEKQVFQYDEQGWPLHRSIYTPNGMGWELVEENSFAYDDYGHFVLDLTMTYENGYSDGYKYEYIYEENYLPYTETDYYYLSGEQWVWAEKALYSYDAQGRTTSQAFYYSNDNGETWAGYEKETATYNDMGLMETYYPYAWDYDLNDWVGNTMKNAQIFHYRDNGQDDWIESFVWENNEWSNYCREYYSYNDNNQLMRHEFTYWNRIYQDWLGGDEWGQYGFIEDNSIYEYTYDEQGRSVIEENFYCPRDADPKVNYRLTRDYTDFENGHVVNEEKEFGLISSYDELELYSHNTIETNGFDYEVHYLHRYYMDDANGVINQWEMVRNYDDETGRYNWTYFYSYTLDAANIRYGTDYETCLYDENGNVSHYHHMRGTDEYYTDTVWIENDDYAFTYEYDAYGNPVKVATDVTVYQNGNWVPSSGHSAKYDFSINIEDCIIWPLDDVNEYYDSYKTLQEYVYADYGDYLYETTNVFYYSDWNPTSINEITLEPQEPTGELRYYDVLGRRVDANTRGLIIVRDTNGNTYKVVK